MSYLTYNSVKLQVESFQRFDQSAIYSDDGADYLYTEITIVSRSFWHPVTNSLGGLPPATPAAVTMDALRKTLLTPRRQLIVQAPSAGFGEVDENVGNIFLKSPLANPGGGSYATDAKNGPQPLFCNIQQIIGEETMIVDFGIVTWINECPGSSGNPISPILSHRWSQIHYIDEMQHTKRVVSGTAVLRSDLLYNADGVLLVKPDDFRDYIFHSIPPNFRRTNVHVDASSDGTRLEYSIEDQEVDGVLDRRIHGITEVAHIEGTYSEETDAAPGFSVSELLHNAEAGALTGAAIGGLAGLIPGVNPAAAGAAAATAVTIAAGMFPTKSFQVQVRVQGTRRSTRAGLVQVAIRAAAGFGIGSLGAPLPLAALRALAELFLVSNSLQIGLVEKWVQLRLAYRSSGITSFTMQTIGFFAPGVITPISAFSPKFPDFLDGVTKSNGNFRDSYGPRGGTLAFGFEKGSRGATIAHLWTQALSFPCEAPQPPAIATQIWNSPAYSVNQNRRTPL